MKKACCLLAVLLVLLTLSSCGDNFKAYKRNESNLPVLTIADDYDTEKLEFRDFPWYSSMEQVRENLNLSLNETSIRTYTYFDGSDTQGAFWMGFPVWLTEFHSKATCDLLFRTDYAVGEQVFSTALTNIQLRIVYEDGPGDCQEIINQINQDLLVRIPDKLKAQPDVINGYRIDEELGIRSFVPFGMQLTQSDKLKEPYGGIAVCEIHIASMLEEPIPDYLSPEDFKPSGSLLP